MTKTTTSIERKEMKKISSKDIEQIYQTIEKALQMHTKWYEDLMRTLLCQLPLPESITDNAAHMKCDFGCWLYSEQNTYLHRIPAFSKIKKLHELMHGGARDMSLNMKENGMILEDDYDYFMRNALNFRNELTGFRDRVLATLEQADK